MERLVKVELHEAQSQLTRLGRLAWEGEEVVIAKSGEPWLRLVPYRREPKRRRLGTLRGKIRIAPDFDETPSAVTEQFEGSVIFPEQEH